MSIRELFRQKLEGIEIVPDASVRSKLMRRLAVQEFLHFDPVRFNIYYLGITLIALIIVAIILSSGSGNSVKLVPLNIYRDVRKDSAIFQVDQPVSYKSEKKDTNVPRPKKNLPVTTPRDLSVKDTVGNSGSGINNSVNHSGINDTFINKRLFLTTSTDNKKLQSGLKSGNVLFDASVSKSCTPLKVHFFCKSDSYDSCRWTFGDGGYSHQKNPEWIFDVEGEYNVVLDIFGSGGLHETSSYVITVLPGPLARFEITPDKAVLPDDEVRFNN
jgi:hypothetical protein